MLACFVSCRYYADMKDITVGVYGMGRFGSFWAKLLSDSGLRVAGYNRSSRPFPDGVRHAEEDEVLACDAFFYCVAISSFDEVLDRTASRIGSQTLVFDTCSVKLRPMRSMKEKLPESCEYIGTHPMFGPDSAINGVEGLPLVFSPGRCRPERARRWADHFTAMGLRVIEATAEEHDREAAYTQGVTHVVGRILGELDLSESIIATSGYKRLLQVREQTCNDPLQLFMDLQHYNPYTHPMRVELTAALENIMTLFAQADLPDSGGQG
jgi:prephenate dehydrogenase